jgi:hypothetical protein
MVRKQTAAGYIYDFENGYVLSFSEMVGEFILYRNNKAVKLGNLSDEAILSTQQEARVIAFFDGNSDPDLEELQELLWPKEVEETAEEDVAEKDDAPLVEYTTEDRLCYAAGTAGAAFAVATLVGGFVAARKRWR